MNDNTNTCALPDPEKVGAEYRKTATMHAVKMDAPFEVDTLEGKMRGEAGDYLAKGCAGELYPIKADIFEASYERADDLPEGVQEVSYEEAGLVEREIVEHKVEGSHHGVHERVFAVESADGKTVHFYTYRLLDGDEHADFLEVNFPFQNGPVRLVGPNGHSIESTLAVALDQLRRCNSGSCPSERTARAIALIEEGLEELKARTRDRLERDVEGTSEA